MVRLSTIHYIRILLIYPIAARDRSLRFARSHLQELIVVVYQQPCFSACSCRTVYSIREQMNAIIFIFYSSKTYSIEIKNRHADVASEIRIYFRTL